MSAPEQDLREELRRAADASGAGAIDVDAVLEQSRRSRRRRRTALLGGTTAVAALLTTAGLLGGLAGLVVPSATTADAPVVGSTEELAPRTEGQETAVAPRDEAVRGDVALGRLEAMNHCGAPVVPATDETQGPLSVTVRPDAPVAAGSTGDAIVTVTNASRTTIEGSIQMAPSVAVADADGTVVALRADAAALPASRSVDLAPGESIELRAGIEAVRCSIGRAPSALPSGDYALSASVVVVPEDAAQPVLVAVSPLVPFLVE